MVDLHAQEEYLLLLMKLVLELLTTEYDIPFPEEKQGLRPENLCMDEIVLPDESVEVLCKKRV